MIKRAFIILLSLLMAVMAVGCSTAANDTVFSGKVEIPENGIVSKSTFSKIKNDNSVLTLTGTDKNGIKYEWTVFGSDISDAKDTDMSVIVELYENESFKVTLNGDVDFNTVLSVYVPESWEALTATVFDVNYNSLCGASITTGTPSIINFSIKQGIKEYIVKGDEHKEAVVDYNNNPENQGDIDPQNTNEQDEYLSGSTTKLGEAGSVKISDGTRNEQDKYQTDPVPSGKQEPVNPEDQKVDESKKWHCTFSIECSTIFNNLGDLSSEKLDILPKDGVILKAVTVEFSAGESVFDVLQRVCRENNIHLEASWTPAYDSAYIEGIGNLYEFDCGQLSGWMFRVNGWYPNYGCSRYILQDGDVCEWRYTCDLGRDVGGGWIAGE